ncbi:MAG: sensor histidine kinase [Anaerolineaceae bacterium]|nr:sensor histidine kinase [Anaerolineaceae bacterium]
MSLELGLLILGAILSGFWGNDTQEYLADVVSTLVPDARVYLQPNADIAGLQVWLDTVYRKGYASLEPQNSFDSPAAKIVPDSLMTVLSPSGEILAQSPASNSPVFTAVSKNALQNALQGDGTIADLYARDAQGNFWMAVPIFQKDHKLPVLGVITLTLEPAPQRGAQQWLIIIGILAITGLLLLMAIAPLGAVYGFVISRGLTMRLDKLTTAAEAWGDGNFQVLPPVDPSSDEIGILSVKMRQMAEKINNLMQDQKALVQIQERNRLAQELHDTVRQQNFATLLQIRSARNQISKHPDAAEKALVEAENLLKSTQDQLVVLIKEMRPPELEGKGLADALKEYAETWSQQACIPLEFQVIGTWQFPFEVEKGLFRVAQEALSNVLRHSRASSATVSLVNLPMETRLIVRDNGVGFDFEKKEKTCFGVSGMQQRLKEMGGFLEIKSAPEGGTSVIAVVPHKLDLKRGM